MTADPATLDRLADAALALAAGRRRVPGATYRVQFRKEFTLRDALPIVPYLDALGVTHLYASPLLKARAGSPHGYDVVDPSQLNPELGTEDDLRALSAALHARGMGLILDTVPNHMCIGAENPWWADVLEHGPSSPYADYFDIAWYESPRREMTGRLLLPVLGEQYGAVLEGGQFRVSFDAGEFSVWYHDTRLPIDPRTYNRVLGPAVAELVARVGVEHRDAIDLTSILYAVENLPPRTEPDPARVALTRVVTAAIKRRLGELRERFPLAADAVDAAVAKIAGNPADPASFGPLDEWLEAQAYRPCFWRVASDEINYRRFFDVNELAAVGTEREDVFRAVHRTLLGWLADGTADGLRIDHPDGLFDPRQYLDRLQAHYVLAVAKTLAPDFPGFDPDRDEAALLERVAEPAAQQRPLYVVVEKILADAESLPPEWACDGTTGYEFITAVNNLFVDPAGEAGVTRLYHEFTGQTDTFPTLAYEKKSQILSSSLSSELMALSHQLDRLARLDRRSRDFTLNGIRRALREVIASFPVYRSYVNGGVRDVDKGLIGRAVSKARKRNPMLGRPLFDFIRDTLLLKDPPSGAPTDDYRAQQKRFAGKFQQLTSPVTAKGVEDTAFYVFNRLVSLNEVGGEPGHFGWKPEKVHSFFLDRQEKSPGSLSPLSTHDTKRSEDARARLNALSELPGEWVDRVNRWAHLNARHHADGDDGPIPDRNNEFLLYQTLLAVWPERSPVATGGQPELTARVQAFVKKALREAKVHSSWINPDPDYEAAVARFVERVLDPEESAEFLADLAAFAARVAALGRVTSLAQTAIRCTAPGVPDTYQGTESWDYSLVDPDNRRPVDYAARQEMLNAIGTPPDAADPRAKLFTVARSLRVRRDNPDMFARGEYVPLSASGAKADHVFAYARRHEGAAVAVVVPRLAAGLVGADPWGDTAVSLYDLPPGRWTNVFTGAAHNADLRLSVAEVLGAFPVAVLTYSPRS